MKHSNSLFAWILWVVLMQPFYSNAQSFQQTAIPNPTNTATTFEYDLTNIPEDYKKITVRIIDTYGRKVADIEDYSTDKTIHKTDFNINLEMASGIYYALLYIDGVNRGHQILQIIK